MTSGPVVTVIVPTYNRLAALDRTLECLRDIEHSPLEVIVVDDGSSEDPTPVVDRHAEAIDDLRLIRQQNRGAAAARNHGALEARGELLIFLDDDMLVDPDHVAKHLDVQARFGPCLANGRWVFADNVLDELRATPFGRYRVELELWMMGISEVVPIDDDIGEPPSLTAANLAVPAAVFAELGGFDESFPHAGYEDHDLSLRAAAAGYRFIHAGNIRLRHNDQRLTLEQFGRRQRQGAKTAVHLAMKDPEWSRSRPFLFEHLPPRRGDRPRVLATRLLRTLLASGAGLATVLASVRALERVWPSSPVLPRLYWLVAGISITRGVREGIAELPGAEQRIRAVAGS